MKTTPPNATGVQIFKNPAFGQMRVQSNENGEALFCLTDVCTALSLTNPRVVKTRLNPKGVSSVYTLTEGGRQNLTFIDEPNLYRCIFQSRKKEAEAFQDWVVEEVLPTIRKTGGYSVPVKSRQVQGLPLIQAPDICDLQTFNHFYMGKLRVCVSEGKVMFCYVDIWRILGFSNGAVLKRRLDTDTFRYFDTPTNQGVQIAGYIDEANLSRCLVRSRYRSEAQLLQKWVETEILPVMRPAETPAIPQVSKKVTKTGPKIAEIIANAETVVQQVTEYKRAARLSLKTCTPIRIAEQAADLLIIALQTLQDENRIRKLEQQAK